MNSVQLNLTEFYSNIELLDDDNKRVFINAINLNYLKYKKELVKSSFFINLIFLHIHHYMVLFPIYDL